MSLESYTAFMQIVEQGSVSAAARVLGVPRPTVSRRLSRLEERVGQRLVQRGGREVVITRAGHALYEQIKGPVAELHAAERALADSGITPSGLLKIAISPLLAPQLTSMLLDFQLDHPEVSLEIITETRFADLGAEGFDVAIRGGRLRNPDLIQRKVATLGVGVYASPEYLDRYGWPQVPRDLSRHQLLRGYDANDRPRNKWPLRGGGAVDVTGSFVTNDRILLRSAAVAGRGIALLSDAHALPVGTALMPILRESVGTQIGLHVVYPERAMLPARARAFIDAAVKFFAAWTPTTEV